jgi:hypothetical protein
MQQDTSFPLTPTQDEVVGGATALTGAALRQSQVNQTGVESSQIQNTSSFVMSPILVPLDTKQQQLQQQQVSQEQQLFQEQLQREAAYTPMALPNTMHTYMQDCINAPNPPKHSINGTQSHKPKWLLDQQNVDVERPVFPGSFLWNGTNVYKVPEECKVQHSPVSISRQMIKDIATTTVGRYKNLPFYRSLPVDGVNTSINLEINWKDTGSGEFVFITTTHSVFDSARLRLVQQPTMIEELKIPGQIFHRLTAYHGEVAEIPLRARSLDVGQEGEILLQRCYSIREFSLLISVQITTGFVGNDRTMFLTLRNLKYPQEYPEGIIHFPWAQAAEVVGGFKSIHEELYHNKLLLKKKKNFTATRVLRDIEASKSQVTANNYHTWLLK